VHAAFDAKTGLRESFDFADQGGGINDNAGADDGVLFWAQNAAGDELEER